MSLLELFCAVDDFWQEFEPIAHLQPVNEQKRQRRRAGDLCESEMITILIHFHQARYRDFKTYYTQYVCKHLKADFPKLISYARFIQRMPNLTQAMCAFMQSRFMNFP
jgi:hypothetical protein